jgi:hypothetical protein
MKQQTAVQWLQEAISKKLSSEIGPYFLDLFDQAKEMEKEQHSDTWMDSRIEYFGDDYIRKEKSFDEYYTHTFTEQPQQ